jgi:hypothetical protein
MTKTEIELRQVTKCMPKVGEERRTFLKRLAMSAGRMSNRKWDGLSTRAKKFANLLLESEFSKA